MEIVQPIQPKPSVRRWWSGVGLLVLTLVFFGQATVVTAATGINKVLYYQGRLQNAAGDNVADGSYNMIFLIYNASSGGTCQWASKGTCGSPTNLSVTVTDGVFTVPLGDTSAGGGTQNAMGDTLFDDDTRYLEVRIGGETISPRKAIAAAAYAFNALHFNGLTSSQFLRADTAASFSGSTLTFSTDTNFALSGGLNGLSFGTNILSIDAASSRVGIGTTSPENPLHVKLTGTGSDHVVGQFSLDEDALNFGNAGVLIQGNRSGVTQDNTAYLDFGNYDATEGAGTAFVMARIAAGNPTAAGSKGDLSFWTNAGASLTERMRILETGLVGIGDSSPDYTLEVSTASGDSSFALSDPDVAHGVTTYLQTDAFIKIGPVSSTAGGASILGASDAAEAIGLALDGLIGVTDPTDNTPAIKLGAAKSDGLGGVQALAAAETALRVDNYSSTGLLTILGDGKTGIGDTTPDYTLEVSTASGDSSFALSDPDVAHGVT
ncbi:MAG: hypothetical protein AAB817_02610, partial [Patescibacteria group bacterium]